MTQSDDSIDEMLINSESWSETSDEPCELRGQCVYLKAWAIPRDSPRESKKTE